MTSRRGLGLVAAAVLVLGAVGWVWTLLDQPPRRGAPADLLVSPGPASDKPELPEPVSPSDVVPLQMRDDAAPESGTPGAAVNGTGVAGAALQDAVFIGRVVDTDGEPVEGATVRHYPARRSRALHGLQESMWSADVPWSDLAAANTGSDGRFRLASGEVPTPDAQDDPEPLSSQHDRWPQVVVQHPDYAARPFLCEGFRAGPYDCGDIVLRPGAALAGRVTDPGGRALAGARLRMSVFNGPWGIPDYGPVRTARTAVGGSSGADGRFELRQLWAGQASFDVLLEGFVPGRIDQEGLAWGEVRELPDVVLAPGFGLSGFVVNVDGEPIAEAEVVARPATFGTATYGEDTVLMELRMRSRMEDKSELRVRADERGAFAITGMADDAYSILVGADGFEAQALRDIRPGGDRLVIALVREATVLVTVQAKGGEERVPGVTAKARRLTGAGFTGMSPTLDVLYGQRALDAAGVTGEARGMLLVRQAGTYGTELIVAAPGFASDGFLLAAVTAPEMGTRAVQLPRESSVAGRVTDSHELPLAGAKVTLSPPEELRVDLPQRETTTGEDGRYRFGALRAGNWMLAATAPVHAASGRRTVIVKSEQAVEDQDIQLLAGARIVGQVIGPEGAPAALRSVTASHVDPLVGKTVEEDVAPDSEGRFELDGLTPGEYRLIADPGADRTVTAVLGQTAEVTLVLRRRPVVRGRVTDAAGPVAGARVLFAKATSGGRWGGGDKPSYTDANGEYELQPSSAGEYAIIARHGDAYTTPIRRTLAWGASEIADLAFGGGWAAGRVVDAADGEPLAGVRLSLKWMERRADGSVHLAKPVVRFDTDSTGTAGRYRFDRLLPGSYLVSAYRRGYVPPSPPRIEVPDGGGVELPDIVFGAGGSIAGRVVTADGSALPPELQVELKPLQGNDELTYSLLDEDGGYALLGLSGGSYRLVVDRQTKTYVQGKPPPAPLGEVQVSVGDGEAMTRDIVIDAPP